MQGKMEKLNAKEHWENVFHTKKFNEVSWYQENPKTSIKLILSTHPDKDARIIDVGGGDSNLIDKLLELGFKNISVLDVSLKALEKAQQRLGLKSRLVRWINSDIREFKTNERFNIWHDRALFHFLTSEKDIKKYVELVRKYLKPEYFLIIATFSLKGPKKCSGLDIRQYSEDSMKKLFSDFEHIKSFEEEHITPWEDSQIFIYNIFRKRR